MMQACHFVSCGSFCPKGDKLSHSEEEENQGNRIREGVCLCTTYDVRRTMYDVRFEIIARRWRGNLGVSGANASGKAFALGWMIPENLLGHVWNQEQSQERTRAEPAGMERGRPEERRVLRAMRTGDVSGSRRSLNWKPSAVRRAARRKGTAR